tara:strand:+ start:281 stop:445 length:165 start_codon:yes stop_codon:yes gene_type:complete
MREFDSMWLDTTERSQYCSVEEELKSAFALYKDKCILTSIPLCGLYAAAVEEGM